MDQWWVTTVNFTAVCHLSDTASIHLSPTSCCCTYTSNKPTWTLTVLCEPALLKSKQYRAILFCGWRITSLSLLPYLHCNWNSLKKTRLTSFIHLAPSYANLGVGIYFPCTYWHCISYLFGRGGWYVKPGRLRMKINSSASESDDGFV